MVDKPKTLEEAFIEFFQKEMGCTFIDVEVEDEKGNKAIVKTMAEEQGDGEQQK